MRIFINPFFARKYYSVEPLNPGARPAELTAEAFYPGLQAGFSGDNPYIFIVLMIVIHRTRHRLHRQRGSAPKTSKEQETLFFGTPEMGAIPFAIPPG